jgi:hypothetical protein
MATFKGKYRKRKGRRKPRISADLAIRRKGYCEDCKETQGERIRGRKLHTDECSVHIGDGHQAPWVWSHEGETQDDSTFWEETIRQGVSIMC